MFDLPRRLKTEQIINPKNNPKDEFLHSLLSDFTKYQVEILKVINSEIASELTFYSPISRSGVGLRRGSAPLDGFISLRNLATLLGINKGNFRTDINHYQTLSK